MNVLHRPMVVKGRFNRDVAPPEIYAASSARPLRGGQPHQRPLTKKKKGPSRGPWPDSVFDDGGESGTLRRWSIKFLNVCKTMCYQLT